MAEKMKTSLIYRLLIVFTIISSVSCECCDFYSNPCSWEQSSWSMSNEKQPDLTQYPNFVSSETDPYFMYIQDWSGSTTSLSSFSILNNETVISFDYFMDSPIVNSDNYFDVEFYNSDKTHFTLLSIINTMSSNWQHAQLTCNNENNYCCGSIDSVPCTGTLRIVANVDATFQKALIAIDSIGTTCSKVTTVPPPTSAPTTWVTESKEPSSSTTVAQPTTVAPSSTHYGCCFFYSDDCGSADTWYYSRFNPSLYIPNDFEDFEWTDVDGATWYSPLHKNITTTTLFTLYYFMWSADAQLALGFKESSSGVNYDLGLLTYSNRSWLLHSFNCDSCCGTSSTCDGQITITPRIPDQTQVGIDTVGEDSACYGNSGCCTFNDSSICGSVSQSQDGNEWQFSGDVYPSYPVPYPGSDFVYFEVSNNPTLLTVALKTELFTIPSGVYYDFNYYFYNSYMEYGSNSLIVSFFNVESNYSTQMFVSAGTTQWTQQYVELYYSCDGFKECTGYFEFIANVDYYGSDVFYAIESIVLESGCDVLSEDSKNTRKIQLQYNKLNEQKNLHQT